MGHTHSHQRIILAFMVCAFVLSTPVSAHAQAAMETAICFATATIQGAMGVGMAILGICAVAAAAVLGKASWGMALTVCVGISILFGAATLASDLGIGNTCYKDSGITVY